MNILHFYLLNILFLFVIGTQSYDTLIGLKISNVSNGENPKSLVLIDLLNGTVEIIAQLGNFLNWTGTSDYDIDNKIFSLGQVSPPMTGYIFLNNQSIKLQFVEFKEYEEWVVAGTIFDKSTNNSIVFLVIQKQNKGLFLSVDMKTFEYKELLKIDGPPSYPLNYDCPIIWDSVNSKVYIGLVSNVGSIILEYDIIDGNLMNNWILQAGGFVTTIIQYQGNILLGMLFERSYSLDLSTGIFSPISPNSCHSNGETWNSDILFNMQNNLLYSFYRSCGDKENIFVTYDFSTNSTNNMIIKGMNDVNWINLYN